MKKLIIFIALIAMLVGCSDEDKEMYEKIEYESVEDLLYVFEKKDLYLDFEVFNDVVFTIQEDDLSEEVYGFLYNGTFSEQYSEMYYFGWMAYHVAGYEFYCDVNKSYYELFASVCYVDEETEIYTYRGLIAYKYTGIKAVQNSNTGAECYDTNISDNMLEGIHYANAIVNNEEGSSKREEALEWYYNTAIANGKNIGNKQEWVNVFVYELEHYKESINNLEGQGIEYIVDNYDDVEHTLQIIDSYLEIINPISE